MESLLVALPHGRRRLAVLGPPRAQNGHITASAFRTTPTGPGAGRQRAARMADLGLMGAQNVPMTISHELRCLTADVRTRYFANATRDCQPPNATSNHHREELRATVRQRHGPVQL